jgi:hypothetical protein
MQQSLKSHLYSLGFRLDWSKIPGIAESAPRSSVLRETPLLGRPVRSREFSRDVISGAEVDFIGSLAEECRVRHHGVVLIHPEGDKPLHTLEAVEHMQVKPLVT